MDFQLPEGGHWIWDEDIKGISFIGSYISSEGLASDSQQQTTKKLTYHVSGTLFSGLCLSFVDLPKSQELVGFRRHVQRPTQDYDDVVTLRDVKDIVIFQVKQEVSQFFLDFFYTPEVDEFLRCLILYFHHYIEIWEWMNERAVQHAHMIRLPGLRKSELRERANLSILRLLVARSYEDLLLGVGKTKPFYHMNSHFMFATQRDIRTWEFLLRLSGRVVWIALQRRTKFLIENEIDRMFRSSRFVSVEHPPDPLIEAVLQSVAGSHQARLAPKAVGKECPREHLWKRTPRSNAKSPLFLELMHGSHDWKLLGLGRIPLEKDQEEQFGDLLQLMEKTEERLVSEGKVIGILGMSRAEMDTMLSSTTAKHVPDNRSLGDVLDKVISGLSRAPQIPLPKQLSKCSSVFPREALKTDKRKERDLLEAREKWRRNYHKVH